MTFTIDLENNITVLASSQHIEERQEGTETFSTPHELAALAAKWPGSRLIEIWNGLPGVEAVERFTSRQVAATRIWKAIQNLQPTAGAQRRQVAPKKVSQDFIDSVCLAVNSAMMWYPKQVLCLQRSVVTTCLLRSHGVQAHMVMGAQRTPFKAHAWVEVDGRAINEKTDVQAHYGIWVRG